MELKKIYTLILFSLVFTKLYTQTPTVGLILNEPETSDGYTLFGNNEISYLIDNCGLVVNTWTSEFPSGGGLYLFPNGNLLRAGYKDGSFNAGGTSGVFELFDWDGDLLWTYNVVSDDTHAHHDMALLPSGNFLITVFKRHSEEDAKAAGRKYDGEVWSEIIQEIKILPDNEGEIVWQWELWDHLVQDYDENANNFGVISERPNKLNLNFIGEGQNESGNWIHANAIDYNPTIDQIAISSRLLSEIWVIDHNTTTSEASGEKGDFLYRFGNPATYDQGTIDDRIFKNQHDIRWIPEGYPNAGALMVFNNNFEFEKSKIFVWQPPIKSNGSYTLNSNAAFGPSDFVWTYTNQGLYSALASGAQPMSNGNFLIDEAVPGHFFEVLPTGKKVWEYINPSERSTTLPTRQGQIPENNMTFRILKLASDYPAFEGKDMSGSEPIERNPYIYNCTPSNEPIEVLSLSENTEEALHITNNHFISNCNCELKVSVYSINGAIKRSVTFYKKDQNKQFDLKQGLYVVRVFNLNSQTYSSKKILVNN